MENREPLRSAEAYQDFIQEESIPFEEWAQANIIEIKEMMSLAEKELPADLEEMLETDRKLAGYLGRSGSLLSKAMAYQAKAYSKEMEALHECGYSQYSVMKAIAEGRVDKELRITKMLERLNRSIVHILEMLRTNISLEKERFKDSGRHR